MTKWWKVKKIRYAFSGIVHLTWNAYLIWSKLVLIHHQAVKVYHDLALMLSNQTVRRKTPYLVGVDSSYSTDWVVGAQLPEDIFYTLTQHLTYWEHSINESSVSANSIILMQTVRRKNLLAHFCSPIRKARLFFKINNVYIFPRITSNIITGHHCL